MQKARRHIYKYMLRPLVGTWFQVLLHFTPLLRVLFTFPSRYLFAIGLSVVFSLTRWCWHVHTRFLRSRATHIHCIKSFVYRTITFYGTTFQKYSTKLYTTFGLIRFRSPLLTESLLFSFPLLT